MTKLVDIRHPAFTAEADDWCKYRSVYSGGKQFVCEYLKRLSTRENIEDFNNRKAITYAPAFAKAAINEIKNVIFNRLRDVIRESTSNTYNRCINGELLGVDNAGASMDFFIGQYILPELLTMRKVGVYVDMPADVPVTLAGDLTKHPYLYLYKAESIKSWRYAEGSEQKEFDAVLLFEDQMEYDEDSSLPTGKQERYRYVYRANGKVYVEFYDLNDNQIDKDGNPTSVPYEINIPEIPFVVFEIADSLLKDVADYQIALLNMESSDIAYAISANFPLYIEQFDDHLNSGDDLPPIPEEIDSNTLETKPLTDARITEARDRSAKVGPTYGRKYPRDSNAPAFIHPSAEPLMAAMEKEKQIKKDIKLLMNLAVNELSDKMVSSDSKKTDESGKQNGLSCVAYVLENGEAKIARYWGFYESIKGSVRVAYPKDYELKSDEQRYTDCKELWELAEKVPSNTFKKELLKRISTIILNSKVNPDVLVKIHAEVDKAKALLTPVDLITKCQTAGLVDDKTASEALGFAEGLVEQAKKDHADKLARIQEAQGGADGAARGIPQTQTSQASSSKEKQGKPKRGAAK